MGTGTLTEEQLIAEEVKDFGPQDSPPKDPPRVVKLSFNVSQQQVNALRQIAEAKSSSMTEVLRHAIALETYFQNDIEPGSRLILESPTGDRRELVLIGP